MDSVPAVYRPTAVQFSKAVLRLNKMTTSTCTAADTTSLEFVEERNGKRVDRRHADNGGPSYETPTPSLSLSRLRKLMHVSLLPLTICTDGAAVLLVDPNGTSRHGNYVQAVKTYLRRRATAQLSASSASRVLWWTAEDAHDCKGVLPLSRARASCADGDLAFGVSGDDCAPLTSSLAKVRCNSSIFLSSVQPDRLTLPFGNGLLLLLMPEAAGASTASADAALGDDARSKEQRHADADASPRAALHGVRPASPAASSLSQDLLTDLCHGYLPSLLESVYPNGGVQLRGCWCTLSSSGDESDVSSARHQQQPHNASHTSSRVSADGASSGTEGAVDDCVAALSIAEALVHPPHPLLTGTSEDPRLSSSAAAVAARVMQSLQPTSLPRAPARANDASQRDLPPALVLDLQPPVMQFALHLGVAAPMQTTKSSAEARSDENSEHVPQSLSSHPLSDTTTSKMRFPAGAMTPSLALAVHEADVVMGSDQRALITAARSTFSKSGLVFVGPLLRGSPRVFGTAAAALSARPAVEAHRSPCQSAMVLTPMGRVELVVEQGANKGLTGSVASASSFGSPVTIRDVKRSLCRCAVGQALQLTEADVALVYAPGTPVLQDQDEVPRSHVVLRLRRRSIHVR
ncbi:hypothetical protein ABB37_06148 [Leptomonas pyrrhocoris]|uniref:Uncharacterized protein n=1 Tax=Leptomonas pyrrhocoris TaxID=157538 RepID=A0A0N0DU94_LEPPY|nr:hypothetical protein ABB37_06148 [Leptomonas pyrrhocoris]KPA78548.1 hypothetical protein ABB37_06148 [Leptomonas pyrrhocoris]|eukprot:XP_015656987.1 hypothetical protein ABB37_06148 [Leptomonas pyrrhocoris]